MNRRLAREPIAFEPIYKERVWGGRSLETVFGRQLPAAGRPYGEAWEVVDRPRDRGRVASGMHAGRSLHDLWSEERAEVFGPGYGDAPADFPLLLKILDARDELSIQVHPDDAAAARLGGEPKTEMWYVAAADPGARLYVGLARGVDRAAFEAAVESGRTAEAVHVIEPRVGDVVLIPSGRIHAIGAGLVLFEIQQNSDTVFRVFDWNRKGLDGRPRDLHVLESLACIDFDDLEPALETPRGERLVDCSHFRVERWALEPGHPRGGGEPRFALVTVLGGEVTCASRTFRYGETFLAPAGSAPLETARGASVLRTTLPHGD